MRRPSSLMHRITAAAAATAVAAALAACSTAAPEADPEAAPAASSPSTAPTTAAPTTPAPTPTPDPTPPPPALGAYGVNSGHPLATRAGMEILEQGGNAIDTAIATAFADAVMSPSSSGLGGGGVALVVVDGVTTNYDYRDVVNLSGTIPGSGTGVPGFAAGMERLHADHGSLPWAELLEPAIRLAADGAPVSGFLAGAIARGSGQRATGTLPQFQRPEGGPLQEGDLLVQQDLADTMRTIAADGADAVYRGDLVPALAGVPGLDAESLAAYEVRVAEPVAGPFGEYTMVSAAPPHPGAAIIQMMQIAEAGGIGSLSPGSAAFVDLQTRAWQVAESSVQQYLGDPAFVDVPVDELTDPASNAAIAAGLPGVAQARATSAAVAGGVGADNTTHTSVVDAEGRAVSMTNTITNYWGSGQYVAGFFLNDALERFGEIGQGDTNRPQPGRRSVTWSSPSMLLDDRRRPVLLVGTPGGRQIPNIIASVVTRWALHDQPLAEAVPADRFFFNSDVLSLESPASADDLAALGWDVRVLPESDRTRFGSVQALAVDWDGGQVTGVADTRRSAGVETAVVEITAPSGR